MEKELEVLGGELMHILNAANCTGLWGLAWIVIGFDDVVAGMWL